MCLRLPLFFFAQSYIGIYLYIYVYVHKHCAESVFVSLDVLPYIHINKTKK